MDHNPPHFHAIYGEYEAIISLANFEIIRGELPPKAISLVQEWAKIHSKELVENWNRIIRNEKLNLIAPLK